MDNIHPIFDSILSTHDKEQLLQQHSLVIWLIGLSGSGKSTIAKALEKALHHDGFKTALLDGDNLRVGLNKNLGFSDEERVENIRRTAEAAKLLANNGLITICSFITPVEELRSMTKDIIGEKYFEVYVNCPINICEQRDVKGLYAKARKGEIKNFTGIDAPFEAPSNPNLIVNSDVSSLEESVQQIINSINTKISI